MEMARQWRNHRDIYRWCRQYTPISDAEQTRWFEAQSSDASIQMFKVMARLKQSQFAVGVCGLTSIDFRLGRAEFSLYIAPKYQGRQFGTGALQCLLYTAFMDMGLHLVWGEAFAGNPATRIFERVGFQYEGTRRDFYIKDGQRIDADLYSITEKEWKSRTWPSQPLSS